MATVSKLTTVEFFNSLLTDDVERRLWMAFITGEAPRIGPDGQPVMLDGLMVTDPVKINPHSLKAFLRAVEYKRGMPVVTVKEDDGSGIKMVEIITIGVGPDKVLNTEQVEEARKLLENIE